MANPKDIIQGLVNRGVPYPAAVGFAGNFAVESGFDTGINELAPLVPGSRGGYGLAQWTGPRRRQFEAYASDRGTGYDDLNTQLDFLVHELGTTESRARDAIYGAQSPDEAARLVSERFLRPGIPHLERRAAEAIRLARGRVPPQGGQDAPQGGQAGQMGGMMGPPAQGNALAPSMPPTQPPPPPPIPQYSNTLDVADFLRPTGRNALSRARPAYGA